MRSSKIISPGQTPLVLLALGHWGNSGLDRLGGTRPSHQRSAEPPSTAGSPSWAPPTRVPAGARQGRGWALWEKAQGERPSGGQGGDPPDWPSLLRQHESSAERSIWLRSGCSVCKGSLGAPTYPRSYYCKRHSSLKGPPKNSQTKKSHAQNGFFQRRIKAEGGAPESWDRDADGRTFC